MPVVDTGHHHAGVLVGDDGDVHDGPALDFVAPLGELGDFVATPVVDEDFSVAHWGLGVGVCWGWVMFCVRAKSGGGKSVEVFPSRRVKRERWGYCEVFLCVFLLWFGRRENSGQWVFG